MTKTIADKLDYRMRSIADLCAKLNQVVQSERLSDDTAQAMFDSLWGVHGSMLRAMDEFNRLASQTHEAA